TLSSGSLTYSVTIPNNSITITNTGNSNVNKGETVYVDYDFIDADNDPATFSCNRTDLFTDFNIDTGIGTWSTESNGTYFVDFGVSDGQGSTDNYTMTINVNGNGEPFKFVVYGDSRTGHDQHEINIDGIINKIPNDERITVINTGDITLDATYPEWDIWENSIIPLNIDWSKTNPPDYIGVVGNHDTNDLIEWEDIFASYLPAQADLSAYPHLQGHQNGLYGSVKYDNTILIWLDSEEIGEISLPPDQYDFLSETLEAASQDPDIVWKFVFFHRPPIPCGTHDDWDRGKDWNDDLFIPYGVDIVFFGHVHRYERTCPFIDANLKICDSNNRGNVIGDSQGVVHVITGGGGAPIVPTNSSNTLDIPCSWLERAEGNHHFIEVEIDGNILNMKVWDTDNGGSANPTLIDDFIINKSSPTQCGDTVDNDDDVLIDLEDPGCSCAEHDNDEFNLPPGTYKITSRISPSELENYYDSSDDAEQSLISGTMYLDSSDLELIEAEGTDQIVGTRFQNIQIPKGATITNAYIEFETDEIGSTPTNLVFSGEAADNSVTFTLTKYDISNRPRTSASVNWNNVPEWNIINERHQTPDISPIIQEIINRNNWASGNALSIIVTGSGRRTAESYDVDRANAPLLVVEYRTDGPLAKYILPDPVSLRNTTGNFWVNYTWQAGAGNVTDSYNISINGTWTNSTTLTYSNDTVGPHGTSTIIVYSYNTSTGGTLSSGSLTDSVTIQNNPITITNTNDAIVDEDMTVYVDYDFTDADSDTLTFGCNRTDLFTDFNTDTGTGRRIMSLFSNTGECGGGDIQPLVVLMLLCGCIVL
ncbi:MAG: metallophosphoesterase, partial [Methanosarcinales archaeon]|nr:metallophosphoesterase [Methanosarcinales archaeon]